MPQSYQSIDPIEIYKKEAREGNGASAFTLGECYEYGSPVEKNMDLAVYWYSVAAKLGEERARISLERLSFNGFVAEKKEVQELGEKDAAEVESVAIEAAPDSVEARRAFKYAKRMAGTGDADYEYSLGNYYMDGYGVKADSKKAAKMFKKAAKQGLENAQYSLAKCYETGNGMKQNLSKAFKWYKKAAAAGVTEAESKCGIFLAAGTGTKKNVKQACVWLSKAAEKGNAEAAEMLRVIYSEKYAESTK